MATAGRLPTIYVPHGGGPWSIVDLGFETGGLAAYLRGLPQGLPTPPRAIVCVSAHWEQSRATVMSGAAPGMLYDYYGFPDPAYAFVWPARGAPDVAVRVVELLHAAGIATAQDDARGFDHGTFVPLMVAYPEAAVPTIQLSLVGGLDPRLHLALGRALQRLRDEGVLILGSGMSYHNLRALQTGARDPGVRDQMLRDSREFDDWLVQTVQLEPSERDARLADWTRAPAARACHPREEHLLPLMVVAGAAGDAKATVPYREVLMGAQVSAIHFG